ncbi:hypothetical protein OIDMADRAFT_27678 [Oidiodendron maius Zn]|uniref:Fatty acid synthase beta subunit AflB /Fas1-like central domain-containing protein n=1 Tax=Oidiodendron maius (strain Zn) TaxID=913774 RepID=A0A0C3CW78_OIDMZ|nr:hypothetical protein OIDMADRAFT_27678 [Oidiodendron maius Zn]
MLDGPVQQKSCLRFLEASLLVDYTDLEKESQDTVDNILKVYRSADEQTINGEDNQYFLQLCQRSVQKPVPFIPVLDQSFEPWFKKETLWQSEDLEAVIDQDIGRTCIIQGPVAVKFAKVAD